jgi:hypothetical protein
MLAERSKDKWRVLQLSAEGNYNKLLHTPISFIINNLN